MQDVKSKKIFMFHLPKKNGKRGKIEKRNPESKSFVSILFCKLFVRLKYNIYEPDIHVAYRKKRRKICRYMKESGYSTSAFGVFSFNSHYYAV